MGATASLLLLPFCVRTGPHPGCSPPDGLLAPAAVGRLSALRIESTAAARAGSPAPSELVCGETVEAAGAIWTLIRLVTRRRPFEVQGTLSTQAGLIEETLTPRNPKDNPISKTFAPPTPRLAFERGILSKSTARKHNQMQTTDAPSTPDTSLFFLLTPDKVRGHQDQPPRI